MPQRASKGAVRAAESSDADIVARARRLMTASGGQLSAPAAVDKARAEAAAGRAAGLASTFDVIKTESGKLDANITAAMEAQLLDYTREAIAKARRKLEDGLPLDAGESALDARGSARGHGTAAQRRPGLCKTAATRARRSAVCVGAGSRRHEAR